MQENGVHSGIDKSDEDHLGPGVSVLSEPDEEEVDHKAEKNADDFATVIPAHYEVFQASKREVVKEAEEGEDEEESAGPEMGQGGRDEEKEEEETAERLAEQVGVYGRAFSAACDCWDKRKLDPLLNGAL